MSIKFLRFGASDNPCFQTGVMQQGLLDWFGSQTGSCPYGPPRKSRWVHSTLEVRDSDVAVFLNGVHVTSLESHFSPKAAGGVVLANHQGNVGQFKNFAITDLPSLPFEIKRCASIQDHSDHYSLINKNDQWSQGFCRALHKSGRQRKDVRGEDISSYQISVDLFSDVDWTGDQLAYPGIIFNARDVNNADYIYFR